MSGVGTRIDLTSGGPLVSDGLSSHEAPHNARSPLADSAISGAVNLFSAAMKFVAR